jgi:hypothetical protein
METKPLLLLSSKNEGASSLSRLQTTENHHHHQQQQRTYDSSATTKISPQNSNNRRGLLDSSTSLGRGKLRFNMRQQMKLQQQQNKPVNYVLGRPPMKQQQ